VERLKGIARLREPTELEKELRLELAGIQKE